MTRATDRSLAGAPRRGNRARTPAAAALLPLAAALLPALGCSPGTAPDARPDLLLVTFDTLRADRLGCYGHARPTSPHLDALAAGGALYELAYAPVGTTCPSHASLFTGLYPASHGVVRNGYPLEPDLETLAESLRGAGYRTAGFVSSFPVSSALGFDQGFDVFDDRFTPETATSDPERWGGREVPGSFDRIGGPTVDLAARYLEGADERPLFLWVHLFDPHAPYAAPEAYRGLFLDAPLAPPLVRYEQEVRYADAQLGRLLEAWRAARGEGGLVVVTADHGEGLGDHGHMGHNRSTYEEEVRVPLVVSWPGRVPPARHPGPAHLVDLVPTLRSLLGLGARGDLPGLDLAGELLGRAAGVPGDRPVFLQRPYYAEGRPSAELDERGWGLGLRRGRWKLFEAPEEGRRTLFDLATDPGERDDLADRRPELADELAAAVRAWHAAALERGAGRELEVPAGTLPALEALGYLEPGSAETPPAEPDGDS